MDIPTLPCTKENEAEGSLESKETGTLTKCAKNTASKEYQRTTR